MSRRLTSEEFITRARSVHGGRYDYSESEYRNCSTPITIICRVHGPFVQSPDNHFAGKGCGRCAGNQRRSVDEAIEGFRKVHGESYDYDPATIRGDKCRVRATCRQHGLFSVSFQKHLRGAGCPECTGHYHHQAKRHFVNRARAVHGPKYGYGEYTGAARKMKITCPVHGVFTQTPASHLQGHGCKRCADDRKRLLAKGGYSDELFILHPDLKRHPATFYIVEFKRADEFFLKVGVTRTGLDSRFKSGYRRYQRRLIAARVMPLQQAVRVEQRVLKTFRCYQTFPRQNRFSGRTECLDPSCTSRLLLFLGLIGSNGSEVNP